VWNTVGVELSSLAGSWCGNHTKNDLFWQAEREGKVILACSSTEFPPCADALTNMSGELVIRVRRICQTKLHQKVLRLDGKMMWSTTYERWALVI
jgi:hypothetical protein